MSYLLPVLPARGGAEVASRIYYKTFHICKTCMRRAPARPVRARCVRVSCTVAVQKHDLLATTLHCKAKRRLSLHFTVPSSHSALHKPHFISSSYTSATFFTQQTFTQRCFYTKKPEAFAHRSPYTEKLLHRKAFTHSKLLHTEAFTHTKLLHRKAFYTQQAFTQRSFYTE